MDYEYSNHFGFLEEEVFKMMDYYEVETNKEEIKKWYKGYEVVSNSESGYGRYDVMLIPRDSSKLGIIFEFKKKDEEDEEGLEICAQNALKQIEDKKYRQRLLDKGIKDIIDIGIAFDGKKVLIKSVR